MHLQLAPSERLTGLPFSITTIAFGTQSDLLCVPDFYPTISNGMTLHPPLSGGSGGVGAVSGSAVSMKLPILSAAWSCIWFVTWVYVSSVKPAL